MFRNSMFYRHVFKGSGRSPSTPLNSLVCGRSEIARYPLPSADFPEFRTGCLTLKKVLALAVLFILLAGCLQSEPIQSETTTVQLDTPSAGWQLAPLEAWETDEAIYCLFQLSPPPKRSAQVISSIVSEMQLPASEKLKKRVVLGKTWNWSSASDIEFPISLEAFKEQLGEGARGVDLLTPES